MKVNWKQFGKIKAQDRVLIYVCGAPDLPKEKGVYPHDKKTYYNGPY